MAKASSYVRKLNDNQIIKLRQLMSESGWEFSEAPHAHWRARKVKMNGVAYKSGKFCLQGKGFEEFIQFVLEPLVFEKAEFGYENELLQESNPEMFTPHAGIDESGKGDYFGPLVIASVFVEGHSIQDLLDMGIRDSKLIKNDKKIIGMAIEIRKLIPQSYSIVAIGPEAYNRLYKKIANLNKLLAWGHARSLENLLDKVPHCTRAISDQFGKKKTVQRALLKNARKITLEQYPRAEADIAVAAASILARAEFVQKLKLLGDNIGITLPKGASPMVVKAGREIYAKHGEEGLQKLAKMHFKTTQKVMR